MTKEPTYTSSNNTYIRLKIKECGDWLTNVYIEKPPNENTRYKCLTLLILQSISKVRGNEYYPQIFIYDCEYCLNNNLKNINRKKLIKCDFQKSSSDESDNEPESETCRESEEFEKSSKKSKKFAKKSKKSSKKFDDDESDNNESENNESKTFSKKSENSEPETNEPEHNESENSSKKPKKPSKKSD